MTPAPSGLAGFVGLGAMGAPMARALARAGHALRLLDARPGIARDLARELAGAEAAANPADLAGCGTVILMLPDSAAVRAVCEAPGGLAAHLAPGSTVIDMSSSDPVETRRLGAALAGAGLTLLDAPVSGGVRKAESAELAIMLGSDDAAAASAARPLLSAMGRVMEAGPLGAGHAAKALNNYVSAAGLMAACEAAIIGRDFGLDPARLTEIINASTGRNNSTENKMAQFILSGRFAEARFARALMAKDVALAAGLAGAVGRPLPAVRATEAIWRQARAELEPGADHTEIFRWLDARE